eukprot:FR741627.1.p2 GENE.FR741627.1~~FR741627.1.p2  ORF type:complete len:145 (+),score=0.82 FR741627.1:95-529(+)
MLDDFGHEPLPPVESTNHAGPTVGLFAWWNTSSNPWRTLSAPEDDQGPRRKKAKIARERGSICVEVEHNDPEKVPWVDESTPVPAGWMKQVHPRHTAKHGSVYTVYFASDGSRYRSIKTAIERMRDDGEIESSFSEKPGDVPGG